MCARLYGELLEELGVLPKGSCFVETSGAKLVSGGVAALQGALDEAKDGGLLFVDEAYQLNPSKNQMGGQVLDVLLTEMENRRGSLVVAFAGYADRMEDLLDYNEGLSSRFRLVWNFEDFSVDELVDIITQQLASMTPPFTAADKHVRIMARRLGRQRGTRGFGNARAVRNWLENSRDRQAKRVLSERGAGRVPDVLQLSREDLLGPRTLDVSQSEALRDLHALRGLEQVKASVRQLLLLVESNAEREDREQPVQDVCLNRLFLGGPGTGKTTVASIFGRVLAELGLLSKGDVLVKNPSDFIGGVLGASEANTKRILSSAVGCVLVIDEPYGLHSGGGVAGGGAGDPYRSAVVDTIVAEVQGVPGADICVLLLGYEEEMRTFLRDGNPGLQRRFQMENAFIFDDFSDEDLLQILVAKAAKQGWEVSFDDARAAVRALAKERVKPNFGTCATAATTRVDSPSWLEQVHGLRGACVRSVLFPLAWRDAVLTYSALAFISWLLSPRSSLGFFLVLHLLTVHLSHAPTCARRQRWGCGKPPFRCQDAL